MGAAPRRPHFLKGFEMYKLMELAAIITIASVVAFGSYLVLGYPTYELVTVLADGEAYADRYYTMDDCSADMFYHLTDEIMDLWGWREVRCDELSPWQVTKNWLARLTR